MAPLCGQNMTAVEPRSELKQHRLRDVSRADSRNLYYMSMKSDLPGYQDSADMAGEKVKKSQGPLIARRLSSADTEVSSTLFRRMSSVGKQYVPHSADGTHGGVALPPTNMTKGISVSARDPPRNPFGETNFKSSCPVTEHRRQQPAPAPTRTKGHSSKQNLVAGNTVWELPEKYKVIDIVGSGSYGQVCRAFDIENQRYVAIKRIHKVFEDLIDCKRILREIAILNRLDHPNVVKVLDIVIPSDLENFNVLYVVLEIAASDIKLLVRSPAFLNDNHIRLLIYNLLCGVNYLHAVGIYHRDLKPANCLVNRDCSVKICDFGLARTVSHRRDSTPLSVHGSYTAREVEDEVFRGDSTVRTMPDSARLLDYNEELAHFQRKKMNETFARQLTGHVVTRWYRAPELILLQENYTSAIDVWSIGCIFAELLNMVKMNVPDASARSPLFPGSSCFPLSPDNKNSTDRAKDNDQLNIIFNVIGTPSEEDIAAIAKPDVRRYVRMFHKRNGVDLYKRFRATPPLAVDLLQRMLVFNPEKRIKVSEALQHEYFRDLYNPRHAEVPSHPVVVPFNDWINMSEGQLRYAFLREIQRHHPEFKIPLKIIYKP
ncbi:cell-cycle-associated kinase MAPK [Babesia ovata]|uniref:Mitogen-activated protein kinase n=1 Tax=Babesia ovata TaxID=189622 RepID=A0A2H6K9H9_9APIC|nr:cell-cycle-associated kinase MAPK [Babesia ovata]GBE59664.1 cell-cycle-associated kinase MAPK [Babesia ovata]